jgi:AraC-like DNA-binding protein
MNRFRVSSFLPRRLEELGVSPSAVLRLAGLPMTFFNQEKILVTTEELFGLWRAISESSNDPLIGLKLGSEERIERYDPIAIAALYTRTFRDALERMARYKQLTCPEEISIVEKGRECTVQFKWLAAKDEEPPVLIDVCFAWIIAIGRRGTGGVLNPIRVELQRTPAHRAALEAHYGCPVKFKAGRNALVFGMNDIMRPFLTHNPDLLGMIAPQLEAELSIQAARKNFREEVKVIVKRLLAGQRPVVQHLAKELNMSSRTLQRRLAADGASFQQLLEEARRELARHYLLHSTLELNETAYLLGYENSNSFFRAFHNWEGTSPAKWRSLHIS